MKTKITSLLLAILCLWTINTYADSNADLVVACRTGNLEAVKKAIGDGAQVNALDASGNPAISFAFFWPDIVKYLLENKADPNLGNTTVLNRACYYASADVIKMLLDAGADPNKSSKSEGALSILNNINEEKKKGKSANKASIKQWEAVMKFLPLDIYNVPTLISNNNCVPCLQALLDKGAKVELGMSDGNLLHTFATEGATREYRKNTFAAIKPSIEGTFKVPDWYVNPSDENNGTPDQILKLLLSKGLKINDKNKGSGGFPDRTPLDITLADGLGNKEEVCLALVNNGADVKGENKSGAVILLAAQCGFATVLKAMIEKGADINEEGKCWTDASNSVLIKDFTPLSCAALKNHLEAVKVLIDKGAKTNGINGLYAGNACAPDLRNKSAIYFAIENKNLDMVKYLAEHNGYNGKKLSITAKKMSNCVGGGSYTPSEFAKVLGQTELYTYLKSKNL